MNYEKTLMELMERVIGLEERVGKLENSSTSMLPPVEEKTSTGAGDKGVFDSISIKYTRSQARSVCISKLSERFKEAGYENIRVYAANREQGGGIIVDGNDLTRPVRIRFYYSKSYGDYENRVLRSNIFADGMGWFTVNLDDVQRKDADLIFFSMPRDQEEWVFFDFVFTVDELVEYRREHRGSQSGLLHLYLTTEVDPDSGSSYGFENREGRIDVTEHFERVKYKVFNRFLKDGGGKLEAWIDAHLYNSGSAGGGRENGN